MDSGREEAVRKALPVLNRLEEAGYEGYLVGGCVREALRVESGKNKAAEMDPDMMTDLDIATDAAPEQVREIFSEWPVIETGLKHGTLTVLIPGGGSGERIPVEITTYRVDGGYSDGRRPDHVRFVSSIEEDLSRRDFTVNAMAMGKDGIIVDPFGGQADLKKEILRAVGDPQERFREDGLRILRALRFSSVLEFTIERETEKGLLLQKDLLKKIASERIFSEFRKLLRGKGAGRILRRYCDVISVVIPEIGEMKGFEQHNPYHRYDVLEHCIRAMEAVEVSEDDQECLRLAALFHDVGKPDCFTRDENGIGHFYGHPAAGAEKVRKLLRRLRCDRSTILRVESLVRCHDLVFQEEDRLLKRWMRKYTPDLLMDILTLKKADNTATGNASDELLDKFERIRNRIEDLLESDSCFRREDLAVSGADLLEAGIKEGPEVGRILDRLLEDVVDGKVPNEREALLKEIRKPEGTRL